MTARERHAQARRTARAATIEPEARPGGDTPGGADTFLKAADAAIERALSGAPEQFLQQNRQLGGQ